MNKRLAFITVLLIAILTAGILVFIYYTNDHSECVTILENSVSATGEMVTVTKHICNESFNL